MQSTIFAVSDDPFCLWERDVKQRNLEFLDGLDPDYFYYVLETHLNAEDEKRAVIALRQSLHHAIETMFSLLGAFVQAPDCVYAWIAKCSNTQLREVVGRITQGDPELATKLIIPAIDWRSIAAVIFATYLPGTERQSDTVERYATLWVRLSSELTNEAQIDEHNSLKHGFRFRSGGFALAFGVEPEFGVSPPESVMRTLGGSTFGATFFKIEKLGPKKSSPHIRSRRTSVNWSLERTALLLQLAHMSICNVISALRIVNGVPPAECKFLRPQHDSDFERPWLYSTGVTSMNLDFTIDEQRLSEVTKSELLERLRKKNRQADE
ncbi:hypothetical protein NX774_03855 [Massilia agilis]|uniref:Immunity protein 49 of polymorphic toxin system n=1 Tax=Massilia agilis TaxID=1811226 RepID=A0ABT2D7D8_9BURK|nr:hypothetical protein [Massilia agilis]MCS0807053.1 hypothetical protein [Massilia agilis]